MEAIAAAASISKASLYRRWPHKAALVFHVVFGAPVPPLDLGPDVEVNLHGLIQALSAEFTTPDAQAAMAGLLADFATHPELAERVRVELLGPAYAAVTALLQAGQHTGLFRSDIDRTLVADMLFGTVFTRALILDRPLAEDGVETLVDHVLRSIRNLPAQTKETL